jgi:hypothetical protein
MHTNRSLNIALIALVAVLLAPIAPAQLLVTSGAIDLEPTTGAATMTVTSEIGGVGSYATAKGVAVYRIDWTSSAGGAVTATIPEIVGTITRVTFNPDAGAAAPSDNYDVTLSDADGFDVLGANGANLDEANTTSVAGFVTNAGSPTGYELITVCGALDLAITNAGDSKGGQIAIYVKRE